MGATATSEIFLFERFRLDRRRGGGLFCADENGGYIPVTIGARALDVLSVLVQRHGDLVLKEDIMTAVWGGTVVADSNLPTQIFALRRILDEGRAGGSCIQTVAGRGYRFVASVTHSAGDALAGARALVRGEKPDQIVTTATRNIFAEKTEDIESSTSSAIYRPPAERRPITVLSASIVGSPLSASELDPEQLLDTMAVLYRDCAEAINRYDGFVANLAGNGLLAYFGYPAAHEDDSERAARAGLTLVDIVGRFEAPYRLQARVGIATGLVVIGGAIAERMEGQPGVVGAAPNLATTLQALAEPSDVLIAESTRRQLGTFFDLGDLGPQQSGGACHRIWRVLGERRGLGRFEALRSSDTPLVGRDEEVALLLRLWTQAKAGDGHAALISGEAGVGKSRLAAAFEEHLEQEPYHRLRYFCSAYHQNSALHPIIAQLERAAQFERDDTLQLKLEKLETLLTSISLNEEDIALLADLLLLPLSSHYPPLNFAPQRKKEKTYTAWLHQLEALAKHRPVVVVFEDLQWIDPTSRELLDLIIERVEQQRVLLIITFRPEFQPLWVGQPQVSALSLNRLNRRNAATLVRGLVSVESGFPNDVVDAIVERCDGVPLFLEELTKAVEEAAGVGRPFAMATGRELPVPATLHASLIARLDRLGSVPKEVAQLGATIGRRFSFELLAAAATQSEPDLQAALTMLIEAGLVFQRGAFPQASFLFKHALVQEAAYGTLLRTPRQLMHARVADALLSADNEKEIAPPEIIAYHLENAGRSPEAIHYWGKAGEQAARHAANREAIEHFHRALSLLQTLPESPQRQRVELTVLSQLAPALMSVHGWSAREVGEVVERAADVGRRLESAAELAPSIANLWLFNSGSGRVDQAYEISADLFRIARELDDPEVKLQAHHTAWVLEMNRGLFAKGSEHIEAGLSLYDEEAHAHHRHVYVGHDPGVCGLIMNAKAQWALGHPEKARHLTGETLVLARRLQHAPSIAHALIYACEVQTVLSEVSAVKSAASELLALSDEQGLLQARANGLMFLGWALAFSGDSEQGVAHLEQGLRALNKIGARGHVTHYLCFMAEGFLSAGRYADGLGQVTQALDLAAEIEEHWYVPRLHQVRAELLLRLRGPQEEAVEASLRQAILVARQLGAKGWELPTTVRLARLWLDRGRRREGRELLAPIYGWFTEGFDTPDLREAKALLEALDAASST
jgi:class 3 adenylate cyclase/predicted ATPase